MAVVCKIEPIYFFDKVLFIIKFHDPALYQIFTDD